MKTKERLEQLNGKDVSCRLYVYRKGELISSVHGCGRLFIDPYTIVADDFYFQFDLSAVDFVDLEGKSIKVLYYV